MDLTAIIYNNSIYGMTGGQFSPMTPQGKYASTSPYGNIERNFDICNLGISAGATYVGRGTTYHMQILKNVIKRGIKHKGFSLVEAISGCPVSYGRKNKLRTPADMLRWQKENAISVTNVGRLSKEELQSRFLIGDLYHHNQPEYTDRYNALINRLQGRDEDHD
jgi:2-oxoglutarate ferredoxin oxidoreductase subunit beta